MEAIREMRAATEAGGQMSLSADIASDVNVGELHRWSSPTYSNRGIAVSRSTAS